MDEATLCLEGRWTCFMSVLILMWKRIRGGTEWGERESKSDRDGRGQPRRERGMRMTAGRVRERSSWQPVKNMRGFHSGFCPWVKLASGRRGHRVQDPNNSGSVNPLLSHSLTEEVKTYCYKMRKGCTFLVFPYKMLCKELHNSSNTKAYTFRGSPSNIFQHVLYFTATWRDTFSTNSIGMFIEEDFWLFLLRWWLHCTDQNEFQDQEMQWLHNNSVWQGEKHTYRWQVKLNVRAPELSAVVWS